MRSELYWRLHARYAAFHTLLLHDSRILFSRNGPKLWRGAATLDAGLHMALEQAYREQKGRT